MEEPVYADLANIRKIQIDTLRECAEAGIDRVTFSYNGPPHDIRIIKGDEIFDVMAAFLEKFECLYALRQVFSTKSVSNKFEDAHWLVRHNGFRVDQNEVFIDAETKKVIAVLSPLGVVTCIDLPGYVFSTYERITADEAREWKTTIEETMKPKLCYQCCDHDHVKWADLQLGEGSIRFCDADCQSEYEEEQLNASFTEDELSELVEEIVIKE